MGAGQNANLRDRFLKGGSTDLRRQETSSYYSRYCSRKRMYGLSLLWESDSVGFGVFLMPYCVSWNLLTGTRRTIKFSEREGSRDRQGLTQSDIDVFLT